MDEITFDNTNHAISFIIFLWYVLTEWQSW